MGEMGDNESVGDTTMFMDDDEVCYTLSITCGDEVFDDGVTSVETVGVGENQSEFFGELKKTRRGGTRGCNDNFRVVRADFSIFVVDVRSRILLSFIKH